MDSAFDIVLGHTVRARSAHRARERYICRSCQNPVAYASGPFQVPHFRHGRAEDENAECELRVAALDREPEPFVGCESEEIDAALACQICESNRGAEMRYFVIYRPRAGIGWVRFHQGEKSLKWGARAEMLLPITENCADYSLHEFDGDVVDHVQIVRGFGAPIVFRRNDNRGICLAPRRALRPGKDYFAVFSSEPQAFPDSLSPAIVSSALGLFVMAFSVPKRLEPEASRFLARVLGIGVKVALIDYAIVSPLLVREMTPDSWATKTPGPWTVRVYCDPGTYPSPVSFLLRRRSALGAATYEVRRLLGESGHYDIELELSTSHASLIHVGIGTEYHADFVFEIRCAPTLVDPCACNVGFRFWESGKRRQYAWSSHRLPGLLRASAVNKADLTNISIPLGVKVTTVFNGRVIHLSGEAGADDLIQQLREPGVDVVLRASGHPNIEIRGQRPIVARTLLQESKQSEHSVHGSPSMRDAYRRGVVSAYALASRRSG